MFRFYTTAIGKWSQAHRIYTSSASNIFNSFFSTSYEDSYLGPFLYSSTSKIWFTVDTVWQGAAFTFDSLGLNGRTRRVEITSSSLNSDGSFIYLSTYETTNTTEYTVAHTYTTVSTTGIATAQLTSTEVNVLTYTVGIVTDGQNSTTTAASSRTVTVTDLNDLNVTVESFKTVSSIYTFADLEVVFKPVVVDPADFYYGHWIISITNTDKTGFVEPAIDGIQVTRFDAVWEPEIIEITYHGNSSLQTFNYISADSNTYTHTDLSPIFSDNTSEFVSKTIVVKSHLTAGVKYFPVPTTTEIEGNFETTSTTYQELINLSITTHSVLFSYLSTLTTFEFFSTFTYFKTISNTIDGSQNLTLTSRLPVYSTTSGNFFQGFSVLPVFNQIPFPFAGNEIPQGTSASVSATFLKFKTAYTFDEMDQPQGITEFQYWDYPLIHVLGRTFENFLVIENFTESSDKRYISADFGITLSVEESNLFPLNLQESNVYNAYLDKNEFLLVKTTFTKTGANSASTVAAVNWSESKALITEYNSNNSFSYQQIVSYTETAGNYFTRMSPLGWRYHFYPIRHMVIRPFGYYYFLQNTDLEIYSVHLASQQSFHWAIGNSPFSSAGQGYIVSANDATEIFNQTRFDENGSTSTIDYLTHQDFTNSSSVAIRKANWFLNLGTDYFVGDVDILDLEEGYFETISYPLQPFVTKKKNVFENIDNGR